MHLLFLINNGKLTIERFNINNFSSDWCIKCEFRGTKVSIWFEILTNWSKKIYNLLCNIYTNVTGLPRKAKTNQYPETLLE